MPTNVEQSDLNLACFGGHGDSPRVVLAPGSVEDCFYTAIEAVNIARKFSVPVFILSDQSIATRIEAFEEPNLQKCCQDLTPDFSPVADYTPYPGWAHSAARRAGHADFERKISAGHRIGTR
jgi:2-oxoglutarate ferredoxin oxidoreductase subunit alpha